MLRLGRYCFHSTSLLVPLGYLSILFCWFLLSFHPNSWIIYIIPDSSSPSSTFSFSCSFPFFFCHNLNSCLIKMWLRKQSKGKDIFLKFWKDNCCVFGICNSLSLLLWTCILGQPNLKSEQLDMSVWFVFRLSYSYLDSIASYEWGFLYWCCLVPYTLFVIVKL